MSLFTDFTNLVAILEKDVPVALELKDAVVKVITDFSPGLFAAAPGEDFTPLCDRAKAACDKHLGKMEAAPGAVGKVFPGDGSFLKALLAIVLQILPLIMTPEPAPTPA